MRTSLLTLARTAAIAALLATTACQTTDRAGGNADSEVTVLTFAQPNHGLPEQLKAWAEDVEKISDGELKIEFEEAWRIGEVDYESATIADVRAGKVDAAWVGARAFDVAGVDSFQALLAPLLVDSHGLQRRVFDEGIPTEMLAGVESLDLVGIGVLPGPMRRMLGKEHPYLAPDDFEGRVVGLQDSDLTAQTFDSLGAESERLPSGADIAMVDGYEQQLDSIAGNHYETSAKHVTVNVNLWPRPLVLFANSATYESLSDAHQEALTTAAEAAISRALDASVAEDVHGAQALCGAGMTFHEASTGQLDALRKAVEPVYRTLRQSPATRAWLERISDLKSEVGAAPDSATCQPSSAAASSVIPEGTYEVTLTDADWKAVGFEARGHYEFSLTVDDGVVTVRDHTGKIDYSAPFDLFRDRFHTTNGQDDIKATIRVDGDRLRFSDIDTGDCSDCQPYHVVWGSRPWVLVKPEETARAIPDGTYTQVVTPEDIRKPCTSGTPGSERLDEPWTKLTHDVELEVKGDQVRQWWTPTDGSGSREIGWSGSYTLFRDKIRLTEYGAPDGDITATWSFDGRQLVISDLDVDWCDAIAAWTSHPWVLAGG